MTALLITKSLWVKFSIWTRMSVSVLYVVDIPDP